MVKDRMNPRQRTVPYKGTIQQNQQTNVLYSENMESTRSKKSLWSLERLPKFISTYSEVCYRQLIKPPTRNKHRQVLYSYP